ncbi:MAG: SPOR domain-containing protein [Rickettsiales bacterium]|jgi:outer membrane biosynthesis protein TonB|nr:SPOR domain-containing protein [Rickettsiales bacterium]
MIDDGSDFFGENRRINLDEENISTSGIAYGEKAEKSSIAKVLVAVGIGAALAGILVLLFTARKKPDPANTADIPTLSATGAPIKIAPYPERPLDAADGATVYNPAVPFSEAVPPESRTIVKPEPLPPPPPKIKKAASVKPAKPAVKPAAKPAPKADPRLVEIPTPIKGEVEVERKAGSGVWNVQLSSGSSEAAANAEWNSLVKKYPAILGGLPHTVTKADVGGQAYWRLRVPGLKTSTEADEICTKLKAYSVSCFVTK